MLKLIEKEPQVASLGSVRQIVRTADPLLDIESKPVGLVFHYHCPFNSSISIDDVCDQTFVARTSWMW